MTNREDFLHSMQQIPNVTVEGNRITIRPNAARSLRLRVNRNGKGYATSYTLPVGCAEAREAGFVDGDGNPVPLEKVVDPQKHEIIFRLKPEE